jgi:cell division initiation protein
MPDTPVELRHVRFKRSLFGYDRAAVDQVVEATVESFEEVWRERADLADKVESLEAEIVRHREAEALLRTTLISAEKAAHELKDQARREAELILTEAHGEARAITRDAVAERARLMGEARKVKALLAAALDAVEDAEAEAEVEPKAEAA